MNRGNVLRKWLQSSAASSQSWKAEDAAVTPDAFDGTPGSPQEGRFHSQQHDTGVLLNLGARDTPMIQGSPSNVPMSPISKPTPEENNMSDGEENFSRDAKSQKASKTMDTPALQPLQRRPSLSDELYERLDKSHLVDTSDPELKQKTRFQDTMNVSLGLERALEGRGNAIDSRLLQQSKAYFIKASNDLLEFLQWCKDSGRDVLGLSSDDMDGIRDVLGVNDSKTALLDQSPHLQGIQLKAFQTLLAAVKARFAEQAVAHCDGIEKTRSVFGDSIRDLSLKMMEWKHDVLKELRERYPVIHTHSKHERDVLYGGVGGQESKGDSDNPQITQDSFGPTSQAEPRLSDLKNAFSKHHNWDIAIRERIVMLEKTIAALQEQLDEKDREIQELQQSLETSTQAQESETAAVREERNRQVNALKKEQERLQNEHKKEIEQLKKQIQGLREELEIKKNAIEKMSEDNTKASEKILSDQSSLREQLGKKTEEIEQLKKKVEELNGVITSNATTVEDRNRTIQGLNDEVQRKDRELSTQKTRIEELEKSLGEKDTKLGSLADEKETMKKIANALSAQSLTVSFTNQELLSQLVNQIPWFSKTTSDGLKWHKFNSEVKEVEQSQQFTESFMFWIKTIPMKDNEVVKTVKVPEKSMLLLQPSNQPEHCFLFTQFPNDQISWARLSTQDTMHRFCDLYLKSLEDRNVTSTVNLQLVKEGLRLSGSLSRTSLSTIGIQFSMKFPENKSELSERVFTAMGELITQSVIPKRDDVLYFSFPGARFLEWENDILPIFANGLGDTVDDTSKASFLKNWGVQEGFQFQKSKTQSWKYEVTGFNFKDDTAFYRATDVEQLPFNSKAYFKGAKQALLDQQQFTYKGQLYRIVGDPKTTTRELLPKEEFTNSFITQLQEILDTQERQFLLKLASRVAAHFQHTATFYSDVENGLRKLANDTFQILVSRGNPPTKEDIQRGFSSTQNEQLLTWINRVDNLRDEDNEFILCRKVLPRKPVLQVMKDFAATVMSKLRTTKQPLSLSFNDEEGKQFGQLLLTNENNTPKVEVKMLTTSISVPLIKNKEESDENMGEESKWEDDDSLILPYGQLLFPTIQKTTPILKKTDEKVNLIPSDSTPTDEFVPSVQLFMRGERLLFQSTQNSQYVLKVDMVSVDPRLENEVSLTAKLESAAKNGYWLHLRVSSSNPQKIIDGFRRTNIPQENYFKIKTIPNLQGVYRVFNIVTSMVETADIQRQSFSSEQSVAIQTGTESKSEDTRQLVEESIQNFSALVETGGNEYKVKQDGNGFRSFYFVNDVNMESRSVVFEKAHAFLLDELLIRDFRFLYPFEYQLSNKDSVLVNWDIQTSRNMPDLIPMEIDIFDMIKYSFMTGSLSITQENMDAFWKENQNVGYYLIPNEIPNETDVEMTSGQEQGAEEEKSEETSDDDTLISSAYVVLPVMLNENSKTEGLMEITNYAQQANNMLSELGTLGIIHKQMRTSTIFDYVTEAVLTPLFRFIQDIRPYHRGQFPYGSLTTLQPFLNEIRDTYIQNAQNSSMFSQIINSFTGIGASTRYLSDVPVKSTIQTVETRAREASQRGNQIRELLRSNQGLRETVLLQAIGVQDILTVSKGQNVVMNRTWNLLEKLEPTRFLVKLPGVNELLKNTRLASSRIAVLSMTSMKLLHFLKKRFLNGSFDVAWTKSLVKPRLRQKIQSLLTNDTMKDSLQADLQIVTEIEEEEFRRQVRVLHHFSNSREGDAPETKYYYLWLACEILLSVKDLFDPTQLVSNLQEEIRNTSDVDRSPRQFDLLVNSVNKMDGYRNELLLAVQNGYKLVAPEHQLQIRKMIIQAVGPYFGALQLMSNFTPNISNDQEAILKCLSLCPNELLKNMVAYIQNHVSRKRLRIEDQMDLEGGASENMNIDQNFEATQSQLEAYREWKGHQSILRILGDQGTMKPIHYSSLQQKPKETMVAPAIKQFNPHQGIRFALKEGLRRRLEHVDPSSETAVNIQRSIEELKSIKDEDLLQYATKISQSIAV